MYEQGLRWLQSCLRRTQNGQSFNSIGKLEIPETVLEELLQNALVHLDLLKTAAIRLLVFDDRVEIINPGSVMGGHTINEVMLGNSFPRNPLMANFCAKTMPYRGLRSERPPQAVIFGSAEPSWDESVICGRNPSANVAPHVTR